MLGFLAKVVARPLIVPVMIAGTGLLYGTHELSYISFNTVLSSMKKAPVNPSSSLTSTIPQISGVSIIAMVLAIRYRGAGKLSEASLRYITESIVYAGISSGSVRAIIKNIL